MAAKPLSKEKVLQLEKVFQVPTRLRIMSVLMVQKSAEFKKLIDLLELTRGNLSMHMKLLEENNYITIKKKFVNNRPQTTYTITNLGKKDFSAYVTILESIITPFKSSE